MKHSLPYGALASGSKRGKANSGLGTFGPNGKASSASNNSELRMNSNQDDNHLEQKRRSQHVNPTKQTPALVPSSKFGGNDTPVSEPAKGLDDDFDSPNKGVSRG